jgi:predicted Zn-dependent protease
MREPAMMHRLRRRTWIMLALAAPVVGYIVYQAVLFGWAGYQVRAARAAVARRDFPAAQTHLREALRTRSGDTALHLLAAQTARRQGDYGTAQEYLRAYRRAHGAPEALAREEQLWTLQKGDLSEADAVLQACVDQPDAPDAPLMLEAYIEGNLKVLSIAATVGVNIDLKKDAGIRRAIDQWLEHATTPADQAQGRVWRGRVQTLAGMHADAIADFRAALELNPSHVAARWHLANSLIQAAPAESAQLLESLHQDYPDDRDVHLLLATAHRNHGDLNEATTLLDELLAATPDDVNVLLERGKVAVDARQAQQAEAWLRRAEKLAPQNPDISLALARCLLQAGRPEEAQRYQDRFDQAEARRRAAQQEILKKRKQLSASEGPGPP